ncbi:hypothetical protein [Thiomicrorhabdus indica]|uniref:hypothetical protein n=1 Tax=Thiomicrorhabdus indica TaxID=2267253 RepID=UPI0019800A28|nr:hypothetical protein [Thiomicrorhabdus indica]
MKAILKKAVLGSMLVGALGMNQAYADNMAEGLNVVVTSDSHQTQLMAMVLSTQTLKKHGKKVHMTLCGPAGDLALKTTETPKLKPKNVSPSMMLKKIMGMGAKVEVCPLYLPNAGKTPEDLIDGIQVAKPANVAAGLLNKNFQNLSY